MVREGVIGTLHDAYNNLASPARQLQSVLKIIELASPGFRRESPPARSPENENWQAPRRQILPATEEREICIRRWAAPIEQQANLLQKIEEAAQESAKPASSCPEV